MNLLMIYQPNRLRDDYSSDGMFNGTANGTANGMANGMANGTANGMASSTATNVHELQETHYDMHQPPSPSPSPSASASASASEAFAPASIFAGALIHPSLGRNGLYDGPATTDAMAARLAEKRRRIGDDRRRERQRGVWTVDPLCSGKAPPKRYRHGATSVRRNEVR